MNSIPLAEAKEHLPDLVEKVCDTREPVYIETASGKLVKVVPVPIPIGRRNGRDVYKLEDMQHLDLPPYDAE
ncbi:MAG TPA: type II toxin-antitoxin system Phd/YefM family antitoxin [Planctomycetota bacterium]|nr:type II toxin-antitoxin system Phd/YefM family antitoxin [Planctomycetota bacterium]